VLAIPTESSYGLAVDPTQRRAVATVFRIKGRSEVESLPVVVADVDQALRMGADLDSSLAASLSALWPAPLSLVVPLRRSLAAAGQSRSLAIRVPAHAALRDLLRHLGSGLTATSANLSAAEPLTDPAAVATWLADEDAAVIDDGCLPGGLPSTLVDVRGASPRVLRRGRFPVEALANCLHGLPVGTRFGGE